MGGPSPEQLDIVVTPLEPPTVSVLEGATRSDGRVTDLTLRLHPLDLRAEWLAFCATLAHEFGHLDNPPTAKTKPLFIQLITSIFNRFYSLSWFKQFREKYPIWDVLVDLWEIVSGQKTVHEVEADMAALKYLEPLGLGQEALFCRIDHVIWKNGWYPRFSRLIFKLRMTRHKRLLRSRLSRRLDLLGATV